MQNVFAFRDKLIEEYRAFSRSFTRIAASDIRNEVEDQYNKNRYWPQPLIYSSLLILSCIQINTFYDLWPTA